MFSAWVVTILRNVLPNLARASSSIPLLLFSQLQLCTGSLEPLTLFCIRTLVQFQLVVQDEKDFMYNHSHVLSLRVSKLYLAKTLSVTLCGKHTLKMCVKAQSARDRKSTL